MSKPQVTTPMAALAATADETARREQATRERLGRVDAGGSRHGGRAGSGPSLRGRARPARHARRVARHRATRDRGLHRRRCRAARGHQARGDRARPATARPRRSRARRPFVFLRGDGDATPQRAWRDRGRPLDGGGPHRGAARARAASHQPGPARRHPRLGDGRHRQHRSGSPRAVLQPRGRADVRRPCGAGDRQ